MNFKDDGSLIVHSNNTLETKRSVFGVQPITADNQLYIRNNVTPPSESIVENPDAWEVSIEGVGKPRSVTVGDLKTMGVETVAMVLQCSGNGRAFFKHETSGTQWRTGAAGCVIWTGVPLRTVVENLGGVKGGAQFVTGTGGEKIPEGLNASDVIVERSVPLDVLDNILLAWDMNGAPIPLAHGGPLRMIVPGFTGVNNIKYVKRVAMTEAETDALIQRQRYRLAPLGKKGSPEYPSVWQMEVKSWITGPLEDSAAGMHQITGLAMGGINAVDNVEVSLDGGKTWEAAQFVGPDLGRYAWRPFVLSKKLAPGTYNIVSRATDTEGNQQPEVPEPNQSGYNYNGWGALGVDVKIS
ncbi:Oxidoreductase molybdopterin binding domain protein [Methyloligella halotolerans]|uniref:Oxidoreductase molybdopterin binding domain protein n=1 Tax=Methyloligella halotolerans TaxID=1177755 RepID=A0A1E2RUY0_9HYPH|nr:sulfite oxidase [Methyloligella halotolerans]ODA65908.1 Oxidoreductase molybdopterin binding domain protein [Methyloligella halotolerans]